MLLVRQVQEPEEEEEHHTKRGKGNAQQQGREINTVDSCRQERYHQDCKCKAEKGQTDPPTKL